MRSLYVLTFFLVPAAFAAPGAELDAAFERYWEAGKPARRAAAAKKIAALDPAFEAVLARLEAGRSYSPDVPTGRHVRSRAGGFHYVFVVPESYDPARSYPVHVLLHGGIARAASPPDGSWASARRSEDAEEIHVFPAGWNEAMWWQENQVRNLAEILDELKGTYNVDENRVYLSGISDGATGVYFHAFRDATSWAAFLPFIGHAGVLANLSLGVDGQMYAPNLANRPFFVVNGGLDRLYPTANVLPWLELFERAGAKIVFRNQPASGHGMSWWNDEAANAEAFVEAHRREPLPDRIVWETERTDRYHRFHWLLITELGKVAGETSLPDANSLVPLPPNPGLGLQPDMESTDGVRVVEVRPGSLAREAGIKKGDVIVEVASLATATVEDLATALAANAELGTSFPVVVERRGKLAEVIVEVPPPPPPPPPVRAFPRKRPSGRVDLVRRGNEVDVRTRGVRRLKLLLSPRQFDLDRPLVVRTNGVVAFEGLVEPDVATLLAWAGRDQDRTMLFAAELDVEVTGPGDGTR